MTACHTEGFLPLRAQLRDTQQAISTGERGWGFPAIACRFLDLGDILLGSSNFITVLELNVEALGSASLQGPVVSPLSPALPHVGRCHPHLEVGRLFIPSCQRRHM